jgi:hypothetical protein
MTARKNKPLPGKPAPPSESHWTRAAKEIGAAVALAALPIIIKTASEALERSAEKRAEKQKAGRAKKPAGT